MTIRRQRMVFVVVAFGALAAMLGLGVLVADPMAALVRPLVQVLARLLGLASGIVSDGAGGWTIPAAVPAANGARIDVTVELEAASLRLMLRGFPIFLALMLAPPWNGRMAAGLITGLFTGLGALTLVYVLSTLAVINHLMALASAQAADYARTLPAGVAVAAAPYPPAAMFFAELLNYLAVLVLPLIMPVILWAMVKPEGLRLLLARDAPTTR